MPFVYMLKNNFNKIYVGVSQNLDFRLKEHNTERGSVFTKSGNFKILFKKNTPPLPKLDKEKFKLRNGDEIRKKCSYDDIKAIFLRN